MATGANFPRAILSRRLPLVEEEAREPKALRALQEKAATAGTDLCLAFPAQVLLMLAAVAAVVMAPLLSAQGALVEAGTDLSLHKQITALPAPSTQEAAAVETKLAVPALSSSAISPHSNGTFRKAKRKQYRPRGDRRK
jgi:hypothetical protein